MVWCKDKDKDKDYKEKDYNDFNVYYDYNDNDYNDYNDSNLDLERFSDLVTQLTITDKLQNLNYDIEE